MSLIIMTRYGPPSGYVAAWLIVSLSAFKGGVAAYKASSLPTLNFSNKSGSVLGLLGIAIVNANPADSDDLAHGPLLVRVGGVLVDAQLRDVAHLDLARLLNQIGAQLGVGDVIPGDLVTTFESEAVRLFLQEDHADLRSHSTMIVTSILFVSVVDPKKVLDFVRT